MLDDTQHRLALELIRTARTVQYLNTTHQQLQNLGRHPFDVDVVAAAAAAAAGMVTNELEQQPDHEEGLP